MEHFVYQVSQYKGNGAHHATAWFHSASAAAMHVHAVLTNPVEHPCPYSINVALQIMSDREYRELFGIIEKTQES